MQFQDLWSGWQQWQLETVRVSERRERRRTAIDKNARVAAVSNEPATEAATPDGTEHAIAAHFHSLFGKLTDRFAAAGHRLADGRAALRHMIAPERFEECVAIAKAKLGALATETARKLRVAWAEEALAERQLNAFRDKHELFEREARPALPDYLVWATLGFSIFLDALLNSFVFAQGSEIGFVGGIIQALMVGGPLVLVGFFASAALRQLHHVDWRHQLCGLAVLVGYLIFLMFYAFAVVALREALPVDPDNAAQIGWARFQQDPFVIKSTLSALLFLASLGFSLSALAFGYRAQDPYPGYSAATARAEARREKREQLADGYRAEITGAVEPSKKKVEVVRRRAGAAQQKALVLRARSHALRHSFERLGGEIDAVYRACIHRYREVNIRVRSTPAPIYFAVPPMPLWDKLCPPDTLSAARIDNESTEILEADPEGMAAAALHRIEMVETQARSAAEDLFRQVEREAAQQQPVARRRLTFAPV